MSAARARHLVRLLRQHYPAGTGRWDVAGQGGIRTVRYTNARGIPFHHDEAVCAALLRRAGVAVSGTPPGEAPS